MAEYIVSEPLKKEIADFKRTVKCDNSDYLTGYICALSAVEGMIAEQTAADVEPVRRGKWICVADYGESEYKCTNCHDVWYLDEGTPIENGMYYCPNCGAKMEEYKSDIT